MKIDLPNTDKKRVVIIGGGFAGIELAKGLKGKDIQVVMIDKHNYHCFQPLMYQVATAALEADSIVFPIRGIFQKQSNFFFRLGEVKEILPESNMIISSVNQMPYHYLVVATGARTNFFGNEGLIISAMPMKNINEALDLRSLILQNFEKALVISNQRKKQGYMNFVIAGAGPTGVELAGALGELKQHVLPKDYPELNFEQMNIYLVHSRDRVLPMLSEKSSERAKRYLEELGVTVVLNTRVLDFHGDYIQTNTDVDIVAKTLLWTAGVEGSPVKGINVDSINRGNRVIVDEYNRVKGYKNIFAIGDVACMETEDNPRGHPMIAPAAIQQGTLLAKNIMADVNGEEFKKFVYKDKGAMATVGKNRAVVEMGKMKVGGFIAWLIWIVVHLMSLVGFRNRMVALFNWSSSYMKSEKGLRVIITKFQLSQAKKKRKKEFDKFYSKAPD